MQIIHRFALSIDRYSELVQPMVVSDASPYISGVLQQKYFKITKPLWGVFVVYWKVDSGTGANFTYITTAQPFRPPSYRRRVPECWSDQVHHRKKYGLYLGRLPIYFVDAVAPNLPVPLSTFFSTPQYWSVREAVLLHATHHYWYISVAIVVFTRSFWEGCWVVCV